MRSFSSPPSAWPGRLRLVPVLAKKGPGLLAIVAPPAVAAALVPLRSHVTNTALALVMVAVVVVVVAPGRRLAALVAGLSAGIWFDFFLTRPYESFAMSHSADIQTTALLLVVAVTVGELAARDRHHRTESASGSDGLAAVQAVTQLVANGAPPAAVLDTVCHALVPLLHLESCLFDPSRAPVTIPYIERPGFVSYSVYRWDTTVQGLPVSPVTLPVRFEGRLLGRFVLQGPLPGVPIQPSRLQTAVVLSDLAGVSLGQRDRQRPLAPAS
jgi:Domain of unknown function (DUF4118)